MGGEFGIALLFAGAVLGVVAGAVFARRSKAPLPLRLAVSLGLFVAGLALPLCFFVAFGLFVKHTSPQPVIAPPAAISK